MDLLIQRFTDLASTDPAIYRSSDLPIQRPTYPVIYRPSDLQIQQSNGPAIHRSSDL